MSTRNGSTNGRVAVRTSVSKLIVADERSVDEHPLEVVRRPTAQLQDARPSQAVAPADREDLQGIGAAADDQQEPILPAPGSSRRVANLLAMLDADRIETAVGIARELISEAVGSCIDPQYRVKAVESQIVEAVVRVLEPILYAMRTPASRQSSTLLPSMMIPIGTTERVVTGLGLSPVIPGTLTALLVARAERQASQIRTLLEISGKLAQLIQG